ncbi:ead/Ea22-like family protein [Escherichia coli]|nr:ead/Ea22-like family protein [Escherichia coli]
MSEINYQALREAAVAIETVATPQKLLAFRMKVTPQVVLALLDERERNQQYIKNRDQENEDIALTVGKLRVELEETKSKFNEQREYYEGVIADGGKRIAELEAKPVSQTYKLNEPSGNSPVTPDGWISCSERMPAQDDWILIYSKHGEYMAGQVQGEYVELSDGTLSWLGNALYWMPLPEPPQEVN